LKANRRVEISRLNDVYGNLLTSAGATCCAVARASSVRTRSRSPAFAIVPSGSSSPPAAGRRRPTFRAASARSARTRSSTWPRFPARLAVVGGGYIASEFASIFNGLGARVTQLYRGEQILRGFDRDIRHHVAAEMIKKGVDIRVGTKVRALEADADGATRIVLGDGSTVVADAVLSATGRAPNTRGLGLEAVGVKLDVNGAGARRRSLSHQRAEHLCRRRRDRSRPAHAGRARRGDGAGRRSLRRPRAACRLPAHPDRRVHPSEHRHDRLSEDDARGRFQKIRVYRSEFKPLRHTLSGAASAR
jgi:glutathione reductase (NADPH)